MAWRTLVSTESAPEILTDRAVCASQMPVASQLVCCTGGALLPAGVLQLC